MLDSKVIFLVCFQCFIVFSIQRSTPADDTYVAAAVEYQVSSDVAQNLVNYVNLISQAAEQDADIIVFPELTLTSGARSVDVPIHGLLKEHPIPALLPAIYDELLVGISGAARQHQIYVLINVQEIMNCTSIPEGSEEFCPERKEYLFNTNVIFDRTGAVIDRYRKINLFGEFTRTPALNPDLGVFTSDFGVTFGHYICFDLMFQVPAVQVVDKHKLTDVLFSTMWFSELPFLSAVQIQEAYAYSQNVNFIGAGANNVRVGSAGSGIYSGKAGALISTMPGLPTTRLLVSRVPKVPGNVSGISYPGPIYDPASDHDSLVLITDPSLPDHVTRALQPGFQEFTLVDKDVSCRFRVRMTPREGNGSHKYRAFVQDGTNTYSKRQLGLANCLLVACRDDDPKSCAQRFKEEEADVEITELHIEMTTIRKQYNNSLECENVVYYPSSFRINKFPLRPVNFTFTDLTGNKDDDNEIQPIGRGKIFYKLNAPQNELMAFGIWGRLFLKDVNHNGEASDDDNKYRYKAMAFDGERSFSGLGEGDTRICSVLFCTGNTIDTCGKRFPVFSVNSTSIFEELTIEAAMPTPVIDSRLDAHDAYYYPVSVDVSIMPLESDEYTFSLVENGDKTVFTYTLLNTEKELYTFAVWGRIFEPAPGSSVITALSDALMIGSFVVHLKNRYLS